MIFLRKHLFTQISKHRLNLNIFRREFSAEAKETNNEPKYESVIGLEVHAQITSNTKLFSGASTDSFHAPANSCVALFDAAIPGTLPRLNRKCVEAGVKTALALSCHVNEISMFDRKHYFYADSPAGFQITQQRLPLATNGSITFLVGKKLYEKTVRLHQLQLEQDSGKSLHYPELNRSLIDLNRAGVPLMELVFEPDLSTGEEAAAMVKELILMLRTLDTCSCKMHEGALRVDANISINRPGEPLGVRTEVKNISSVTGIAKAINYEIKRQIELVDRGGVVTNETRRWDATEGRTVFMRDKEVQQDYRFMPEPNLPPLNLNMIKGFDVNETRENLPPMPHNIRKSLSETYGLNIIMASELVNYDNFLQIFLDVMKKRPVEMGRPFTIFILFDVFGALKECKISQEDSPLSAEQVNDVFQMYQDEEITKSLVQNILIEVLRDPSQSPIEVANKNNWKQISDIDEITRVCEEAVANNPKFVKLYKKGKKNKLYQEVLRVTDQRANMTLAAAALNKIILDL